MMVKFNPCKLVVLISGNGSNLQALIDSSKNANYTIAGVISNKADAYGLVRAKQAGIKSQVLDHKEFASRNEFDLALSKTIDSFEPDLLVLAGFMRILSTEFVQHYAGRTLNIHPSLLPKYPGTNTHQRVIDARDTEHGVSVHFVTEELDGGPVIAQAKIPVTSTDTPESLKNKVAVEEHKLYPFVVELFAQGRLLMKDNHALLDSETLTESGIDIGNPS